MCLNGFLGSSKQAVLTRILRHPGDFHYGIVLYNKLTVMQILFPRMPNAAPAITCTGVCPNSTLSSLSTLISGMVNDFIQHFSLLALQRATPAASAITIKESITDMAPPEPNPNLMPITVARHTVIAL